MIFAYAALFPEKYWPKKISFHGLVISEGEKMSKSKGNVITLLDAKKRLGADIFRFYLTQASNITGTFDWKNAEAENAKRNIEKIYSIIIEGMNNRREGEISKLYLSKFNRIIKDATLRLNEMRLKDYDSLVFYEMMNMIKRAKQNFNDKQLKALYCYIITDWIKLL